MKLAMELIDMELINEHNPNIAVFDPGSQSSFYAYPMAQAFACVFLFYSLYGFKVLRP